MVLFNYSTKELTAKVVYYGPGLCGKTTNLQWIHEKLPIRNKGKMLSLATETDRTLFFDFLPIELGSIRGMKTRIQLYTVPGQVFYNATRRMVLKGADGVVFVCDSQDSMIDSDLDSLENLKENLVINEIDPDTIPIVLQYNKRDLPNAAPLEILNERLNPKGWPTFEASAIKGIGVEETLKGITAVVFRQLSSKYGGATPTAPAPAPPPPPPVAVAPPPPPPPPMPEPEPEPEPELSMAEPEPMPDPVLAGPDDLLDELEAPSAPEPVPMDELQMQPEAEPELQLDVPADEPPPMMGAPDELSLEEEPAAMASVNPSSTVMADPDETAALRARLASAAPPAEEEFPLESMEELPAAEPAPVFAPEEPAAAPMRRAAGPSRATIVNAAATVDMSGTQAEVAIPLEISVDGQAPVHLTLRLTLDLKLR